MQAKSDSIVSLSDASAGLSQVGGKGASLARRQVEQAISQRIGPLRRKWFRKLLTSAQECAIERENAIANIGLPYPQLGRLLRELGLRLAAGGAIAQKE